MVSRTAGGRLDWPGALAIAGAFGIEGDVAIDLLSAGEKGVMAGLLKLKASEGGTDG